MSNPELPKHVQDSIKREEEAAEGLDPKNVEAALNQPGVSISERHSLRQGFKEGLEIARQKHLKNAKHIKKEFSPD